MQNFKKFQSGQDKVFNGVGGQEGRRASGRNIVYLGCITLEQAQVDLVM